jgi:hypothetical protein
MLGAINDWREGQVQVAVQLETVAQELEVRTEDLLQRSMSAFFAHEIRLAEWDIADLKERYRVASPVELEEKIESRQIYSHPAWEDLIEWETLEAYASRLRALQGKVEWKC